MWPNWDSSDEGKTAVGEIFPNVGCEDFTAPTGRKIQAGHWSVVKPGEVLFSGSFCGN